MSRVYSQELLAALVTPGSSAVVILPAPDTYVIRFISVYISNGFPDTGGGFVTVTLGGNPIFRRTFPGAYVSTVSQELRIVVPGSNSLSAEAGGGASVGCFVRVSGYNLTP